jgi:hypothetical protein
MRLAQSRIIVVTLTFAALIVSITGRAASADVPVVELLRRSSRRVPQPDRRLRSQALQTIVWSLLVILIGWPIVRMADRAGVMRPTWPENSPSSPAAHYEELHPFLYSVDVFLPFVDLHQEHYWWPNSNASGDCLFLGYKFRLRGSLVRHYLWVQIFSGWLLSAILLAGISGLMRSDWGGP